MSKSEMLRLADIAKIEVSGVDKKIKKNEKEIKLCNFVDVYHNWSITKELYQDFMEASATDSEIETYRLKKGQVAITKDSETRDDIGVAAYIADDFEDVILGYHCVLITPNESIIDGKYLNFILHSSYAQKYFEHNASGSGQRYTLTNEIVENMPIPVIDKKKQMEYGSLFFEIALLITNNKKTYEQLNDVVKTIYDYWFVQFDFPTFKGVPYKSSGGELKEDGVRKFMIPASWEVKKVGDYCKIFTGKKDVNQALDNGPYKFFSCAPEYKYSPDKIFEGRAVLISGNGSYTGRTIFVDDKFDLYQRTYACVNNHEKDNIVYIYYSLLRYFTPIVQGGTHGSAIPYIVYDDIAETPLYINQEIIDKFQEKVEPIIQQMVNLERKNEELDTIMKDMMLYCMNHI